MKKKKKQFQSSSTYWICEKLIDYNAQKVRDHCYITRKFRGAAHWSCNINLQLTKNVPVIFHNLRGYDSNLIFDELNKFDVKIDVIPNRIKKYMAFFKQKLSIYWQYAIYEKLVKKLSENDFKYLTEEFRSKNLELLKQKDAYPHAYMDNFKRFTEEKLPNKECFYSSVKDGTTDDNGDNGEKSVTWVIKIIWRTKNLEWI